MEETIKKQLRELGITPSKDRGQNFLFDQAVIAQIIEFGRPSAADNILEIGPGLGALTAELSRFPHYSAVEIEDGFCEYLHRKYPRIDIINEDVRELDFSELGKDLLVYGNLPYSFSTDILFLLIDNAAYIRRAVLLLQKEFVERLASPPGSREYGALSINCQLWANVRMGPVVPGEAFYPRADVESRVVELSFLREPRFPLADPLEFKLLVKAAFFRRRKKLVNSLTASGTYAEPQVAAALKAAGISADLRAEDLEVGDYARLSAALLQLPRE